MRFKLVVQPFGEEGPIFVPGEGNEVIVSQVQGKRVQVRRQLAEEQASLTALLLAAPLLQALWEPGELCRVERLDDCYELLCELLEVPRFG